MTRKNKRKNQKKKSVGPPPKEVENAVELVETGEDPFGVDDHLSRLPDLCLLGICAHLTRMDIYNLSLLNSRMFSIGDERSLDSIKWPGGWLEVFQTEKGYGFSLLFDKNRRRIRRRIVVMRRICNYEIIKNGDDFIEKKWMEFDCMGMECRAATPSEPHSWPVPEKFYDCLFELLRHIDVETLTPENMPVDSVFYSKLERALIGHSLLRFNGYKVEEDVNREGRMSLARVVKGFKRARLFLSGNVVNEEFLREVAGPKLRFISIKDDRSDNPTSLAQFFHPDESILPHLLTFEYLIVPTMKLKATWVGKLCMLYVEANLKRSGILFGIDRPITEELISANIGREYECEWFEDDEGQYMIIGKADKTGVQMEIWMSDYQVEGSDVYELTLRSVIEEP